MQYELTEEQKMLQETVRRLAQEKILPRAAEIDEKEEYPWDIKELLAQNELLGLCIPEEYGGSGADSITFCILMEEIAKVCVSSSLIPGAQELGSTPILIAGNEEQKKKYLTPLAKGEKICAFALTEPGAGSDAAGITTKAVLQGDKYILNGTKCFITNGDIAQTYSAFAKTGTSGTPRDISTFIIESDYPGLSIGKIEKKMGIKASRTTEVIFENCEVPQENLLGEEGDGFKIAMMTLDRTRPAIASQGVGVAQGALDYAVNYLKERVVFGKSLASFQGIQFWVADLATSIEAARQLNYKAAAMIDAGDKELSKYSAMCKLYATDVAMKVTTDCVQLLGGYGYMKDYPLERMMRDAKVTQIYEGTNQIQRLVIARQVLK